MYDVKTTTRSSQQLQMKLHNSGLCDCCGETETVAHYLINCRGNGVDRNIKDACDKFTEDSVLLFPGGSI